jgi:hypothetical protein
MMPPGSDRLVSSTLTQYRLINFMIFSVNLFLLHQCQSMATHSSGLRLVSLAIYIRPRVPNRLMTMWSSSTSIDKQQH